MADERSDEQKLADGSSATGEPTGTTQDEGQPKLPDFDASKINVEDPEVLSRLTEDELAKVEEFNKTGKAPGAEPDKGTSAADTAAKEAADAAEKAATSAVKYAGKYATTDDLVKGVNEVGKSLGVDVSAFVDAAKESKEFKSLESLYKRLETKLSERGSTGTPGQEGSPAVPAKDTTASGTPETDPEVIKSVVGLTMQTLASSNIARQIQAKGLQIPSNMEEFEALAEVNPFYAMEFKNAFQELYRANMADVKGYMDAERTVGSANASVVDTDITAIKAYAQENAFKLSDDEINAVRSSALANPFNYETKHGHKFLRPNAVKDQFMISVLPTKVKEISLNREIAGRQQAVADLDKAKKREVSSVGTTSLSTKTRTVQKMPDITDPAVIANLPDAALEDPEGYFLKQGFVK